jgi:hypothetical protein
MDARVDPQAVVVDFARVAALAHIEVAPEEIKVVQMPKPHRQPSAQPPGMLAVYTFWFFDRCLKVGKAGPNSNARYCSHHYGAKRAPSTLARHFLNAQSMLEISGLDERTIGAWICDNCDRIDFLLPPGTEFKCCHCSTFSSNADFGRSLKASKAKEYCEITRCELHAHRIDSRVNRP